MGVGGGDTTTSVSIVASGTTGKPSKAEQRREKKEREAQLAADRYESDSKTGERAQEMEAIEKKLLSLDLCVREMPADGSCLFEAVSDQLRLVGEPVQSASELRKCAVTYMRDHRDEFMAFYVSDEADGDGNDTFDDYCTKMASTDAWGGQLELVALSRALNVQISVVSANAPDAIVGDHGPVLRLTFHTHFLAMGNHYNSAVPVRTN